MRLHRDGSSEHRLLHRLLYEHFIGPIPKGLTVNHRNGIKTDNRLSNLELATHSEQQNHAYALGLQKRAKGEERGGVSKLTDDIVREIRRLYVRRPTMKELGDRFGVSECTISMVLKRKRWSHVE